MKKKKNKWELDSNGGGKNKITGQTPFKKFKICTPTNAPEVGFER